MSDPNLQTAAHNIRQAADEAQRQLNNAVSDIGLKIRENEKRLDDLRNRESILRVEIRNAINPDARVQQEALLRQATSEEDRIRRQINDLRSQSEQVTRDMNGRIGHYNNIAKMLDGLG